MKKRNRNLGNFNKNYDTKKVFCIVVDETAGSGERYSFLVDENEADRMQDNYSGYCTVFSGTKSECKIAIKRYVDYIPW